MLSKTDFVQKYILQINSSGFKNLFSKIEENPFSTFTNFEEYIKGKLHSEYDKNEDEIFHRWRNLDFVKARIQDLAIEYKYKKSHLQEYLLKSVGKRLCDVLEERQLDLIIDRFMNTLERDFSHKGFKSIKSDFKKVFTNSLYFSFQRGFPVNLENLNSGIMTANAGDSHQFLFLARAILAGYECSNVDVRSSRYDAIIDYRERLFKIQIKGITSSTSRIVFRDRDRGGQGIDHTHERNRGRKITSRDCDIYAAVDKNSGTCYLIPMKWVDKKGYDFLSMPEVSKYKEKWSIFNAI